MSRQERDIGSLRRIRSLRRSLSLARARAHGNFDALRSKILDTSVNGTSIASVDQDSIDSAPSTELQSPRPQEMTVFDAQVKPPWSNEKHLKDHGKRSRKGPGSYSGRALT